MVEDMVDRFLMGFVRGHRSPPGQICLVVAYQPVHRCLANLRSRLIIGGLFFGGGEGSLGVKHRERHQRVKGLLINGVFRIDSCFGFNVRLDVVRSADAVQRPLRLGDRGLLLVGIVACPGGGSDVVFRGEVFLGPGELQPCFTVRRRAADRDAGRSAALGLMREGGTREITESRRP